MEIGAREGRWRGERGEMERKRRDKGRGDSESASEGNTALVRGDGVVHI